MKVGSLFSGVGGLDLGLERAGMEIVWQVERDEYARRVLRKHWPHVTLYGDIKGIDFTGVEPVDLICGGFPCQPVSCTGKRRGDKDERWLWPEFYRAVCEVKPRWVLVENVPGLMSVDGGRLFGGILRDLACCGYDAEWDLLPAAAFGAPHLRFRLFLVACARSGAGIRGASQPGGGKEERIASGGHGEDISDTNITGLPQPQCQTLCREGREGEGGAVAELRQVLFDSDGQGQQYAQEGYAGPRVFGEGQRNGAALTRSGWWDIEPDVGRVAHGVPARVDRLKCLGNAVVPQVAEWIGRKILANKCP